MKVLIVEDEVLIAMHLELLVEDFGHQVCAIAASMAEAIAHAAVHLPDVALMDIRLAGGSSGIDAAREIHARHSIRCIFLSANQDYRGHLTHDALGILLYDADRPIDSFLMPGNTADVTILLPVVSGCGALRDRVGLPRR